VWPTVPFSFQLQSGRLLCVAPTRWAQFRGSTGTCRLLAATNSLAESSVFRLARRWTMLQAQPAATQATVGQPHASSRSNQRTTLPLHRPSTVVPSSPHPQPGCSRSDRRVRCCRPEFNPGGPSPGHLSASMSAPIGAIDHWQIATLFHSALLLPALPIPQQHCKTAKCTSPCGSTSAAGTATAHAPAANGQALVGSVYRVARALPC
jgi:hypothetical protein